MRNTTRATSYTALFVSVFLLAGCGTNRVTIRSHARAALQLPSKIKRLAVLEFKTISPPSGQAAVSGAQVGNSLTAKLTQEGYFQIVERSQVSRVTDELAMGAGIGYDPETRKRIGKRLQADALMFGTVSATGTENKSKVPKKVRKATGQYRQVYNPNTGMVHQVPIYSEEIIYVDTLSRDVNVSVDFRLVDVETDQILASKAIKLNRHEPQCSFFNPQGVASGPAIGSVPSIQVMANGLVEQVVTNFVQYISPHTLTVERALLEGETAQCEQGHEMAVAGNWEGARQAWEQASRLNPGDACPANNLGVYYERANNNEQAERFYKKALQLAPTNEDVLYNYNSFKSQILKSM